jgi:hypothetical protein
VLVPFSAILSGPPRIAAGQRAVQLDDNYDYVYGPYGGALLQAAPSHASARPSAIGCRRCSDASGHELHAYLSHVMEHTISEREAARARCFCFGGGCGGYYQENEYFG